MDARPLTGFKRYIPNYFLVIIWGLLLMKPPVVFCQPLTTGSSSSQGNVLKKDIGIRYIRNYSRKEYKNHSQNWAVLQDKRGVIYVANQGGLLEFDGVSWREILVPNISVRSLAMDDKGTIYVGGINEIGFLATDSKGRLRYVSFMAHLDKKYRNFSTVYRTHTTKEGIYFCTSKFLFLWDFKKIICKVKADTSFAAPFLCKGKLYVRQNGIGLLKMKKDSLELIPGGETFSSKGINFLLEYDQEKLLLDIGSEVFYLYDKGKKTPLEK